MTTETPLQHHVEIGADPHGAAEVIAALIRNDKRSGAELPAGLPPHVTYREPHGPDRIPAPATVAHEGSAACGALSRAEATKELATHVGVCRATGPDGRPVHHAFLVAAAKPGELPLVTGPDGKALGPVDVRRVRDPSKDRGMNCGCHVPEELYKGASFAPIHPDHLHPDHPSGAAALLANAQPAERAAAGVAYQGAPRAHLPETTAGRAVAETAAIAARAVTPPPGHEPRPAADLHPHPVEHHPELDVEVVAVRRPSADHLQQMTTELVGALHTVASGQNPHPLPEDPPVTEAHADAARKMVATLIKVAKSTPAEELHEDLESQERVRAIVPVQQQRELREQVLKAAQSLEHVDAKKEGNDVALTVASELTALLPGVLPAEVGQSLRRRRATARERFLTEPVSIGVGSEPDDSLASVISLMIALDDLSVGCPWDGRRPPPPDHPDRPDAPVAGLASHYRDIGEPGQTAMSLAAEYGVDQTRSGWLAELQAANGGHPRSMTSALEIGSSWKIPKSWWPSSWTDPVVGRGGGGGGRGGGGRGGGGARPATASGPGTGGGAGITFSPGSLGSSGGTVVGSGISEGGGSVAPRTPMGGGGGWASPQPATPGAPPALGSPPPAAPPSLGAPPAAPTSPPSLGAPPSAPTSPSSPVPRGGTPRPFPGGGGWGGRGPRWGHGWGWGGGWGPVVIDGGLPDDPGIACGDGGGGSGGDGCGPIEIGDRGWNVEGVATEFKATTRSAWFAEFQGVNNGSPASSSEELPVGSVWQIPPAWCISDDTAIGMVGLGIMYDDRDLDPIRVTDIAIGDAGRAVEAIFTGGLSEVVIAAAGHPSAGEWKRRYGERFWEHPEWQRDHWRRERAERDAHEFRRGVAYGPEHREWIGPHMDEHGRPLVVGRSTIDSGARTWGGPRNGWIPTATWQGGHMRGGRFVPGHVRDGVIAGVFEGDCDSISCRSITDGDVSQDDVNIYGWGGWDHRGRDRVIHDRRAAEALRRYWADREFRNRIDRGEVVEGIDLVALHEILDPPISGWWGRLWGRGHERLWWRRNRGWDRGWDWWATRMPVGHPRHFEWFRRFHSDPDFRRRAEAGEIIDGLDLAAVLAWARENVPGSVPDIVVGAVYPTTPYAYNAARAARARIDAARAVGAARADVARARATAAAANRAAADTIASDAAAVSAANAAAAAAIPTVDQFGNTVDQFGAPLYGPGGPGSPIVGPPPLGVQVPLAGVPGAGTIDDPLYGVPTDLFDSPVHGAAAAIGEGVEAARTATRGRPCRRCAGSGG